MPLVAPSQFSNCSPLSPLCLCFFTVYAPLPAHTWLSVPTVLRSMPSILRINTTALIPDGELYFLQVTYFVSRISPADLPHYSQGRGIGGPAPLLAR